MTAAGAVLTLVVTIRLIVPLLIGRFPLPALVAAIAIDAVDQSLFSLVPVDLTGYQTYDKALDVYALALLYLATIRNWGGGPNFEVGRALWYLRLLGVALFEYSGLRWLLFAFPNAFQEFALAIEAYTVRHDPRRLARRTVVGLAAVVWIVVKLPQEWWLHIAQLDVTDVVKTTVFGAAADDRWGEAIRRRPTGVVVLAVAAAAVSGAAIVAARRWLPPPQWPRTFDANRQALAMGWRAPRRPARPTARFDWTFVEKVVLVSLVSVIFARILPGADTRIDVVVVVTGYVIAVNTSVSEWLARRRSSWRNPVAQFAVMGAIDAGSLLAFDIATGPGDSPTPLGTTLFLIGLLTLIVVVYDRSHTVLEARIAEQAGRERPAC